MLAPSVSTGNFQLPNRSSGQLLSRYAARGQRVRCERVRCGGIASHNTARGICMSACLKPIQKPAN